MRRILAIILGKLIWWLSRTFSRGGGSAAPGFYALKFYPNLVADLARQIPSNVVITGTNGKTTTAKLLGHFAKEKYRRIIRNETGSNLERGVASTLIKYSNFLGQIRDVDLAIWEVDEAAFNTLVPKIQPAKILILNAFRDQLDRYGEVDTIIKRWRTTLEATDWPLDVVINASDPNLRSLMADHNYSVSLFAVSGHEISWERLVKLPKLEIKPNVLAKVLKTEGLKGSTFELDYPGGKTKIELKIAGVYHVYDVVGAFTMGGLLDLDPQSMIEQIETFKGAFGRVETIKLDKNEATVFLIKNPVGASLVFETINQDLSTADCLVMMLNDNFADGTDVSWIWDANFESLNNGQKFPIVCSGTRAADLAVRLKYAGIKVDRIKLVQEPNQAIKMAQELSQERIIILPTYTALLHLDKIFTQLGVKNDYWQEISA